MDINEIRRGATVYLRAQREGGLLALGDLHAYQGEGEISGTAKEADGEVKLTVTREHLEPLPASSQTLESSHPAITTRGRNGLAEQY